MSPLERCGGGARAAHRHEYVGLAGAVVDRWSATALFLVEQKQSAHAGSMSRHESFFVHTNPLYLYKRTSSLDSCQANLDRLINRGI
jgi:hypothetical protein